MSSRRHKDKAVPLESPLLILGARQEYLKQRISDFLSVTRFLPALLKLCVEQ